MKNTWGYGVSIMFKANIIVHVKSKGSFFKKSAATMLKGMDSLWGKFKWNYSITVICYIRLQGEFLKKG